MNSPDMEQINRLCLMLLPGHEVNIDLGDRKVTGEISASTDIDLSMDNVEEVFERKTNNNGMAVHIAVSC